MYLTEIESSKVEETIGKCYPLWYPIHFQTLKRGSGWLFWGDLIVGLRFGDWIGFGVGLFDDLTVGIELG